MFIPNRSSQQDASSRTALLFGSIQTTNIIFFQQSRRGYPQSVSLTCPLLFGSRSTYELVFYLREKVGKRMRPDERMPFGLQSPNIPQSLQVLPLLWQQTCCWKIKKAGPTVTLTLSVGVLQNQFL